MLGPCPGNQELIAKSDVVVAINYIIPAYNDIDEAMAIDDPGHMDIRGLSCLL